MTYCCFSFLQLSAYWLVNCQVHEYNYKAACMDLEDRLHMHNAHIQICII